MTNRTNRETNIFTLCVACNDTVNNFCFLLMGSIGQYHKFQNGSIFTEDLCRVIDYPANEIKMLLHQFCLKKFS